LKEVPIPREIGSYLESATLVWHSAKEFIAGRLFENIDQLKDLLDRLLNQGELEIRWSRKLKNKGNLVNAI